MLDRRELVRYGDYSPILQVMCKFCGYRGETIKDEMDRGRRDPSYSACPECNKQLTIVK